MWRLSKSKFLAGLQCHKRLYLEVHAPELATPPDPWQRALFESGTAVGQLARRRFPGGVLVGTDPRRPAEAIRKTAELVLDPRVPAIFEGAFEHDGVLVRVDILERAVLADSSEANRADLPAEAREASEGGWRLIEVKSSTKAKEIHVADLAIQAHVLSGAGLSVDACLLMHVNTGYLHEGGSEPDLEQLFAVQDLTGEVERFRQGLSERLAELKEAVASPRTPSIEPGSHCHAPYECPFWTHCTRDKPARWIYHLPGSDQVVRECVEQGIHTIDEIPATASLTLVQRRVKENAEWVGPRLGEALRKVSYPVHHLDLETFMPPVPRFPRTRPYQAIPTQWSNHTEGTEGQVWHEDYLCMAPTDPREELARALLRSLGREGSICVYSGYERAMIQHLAEALPALAPELRALMGRLWDLLAVIKEHYYHPAFQGSYSIKTVLPALVPELGYTDLDVREGGAAAQLYERMVFHETDWVEKARLRDSLLAYCQRDTLGMLEIRRALRKKASAVPPLCGSRRSTETK